MQHPKPSVYGPSGDDALAALAMTTIVITVNGVGREADEGTDAHLFQLLMVASETCGPCPSVDNFQTAALPRCRWKRRADSSGSSCNWNSGEPQSNALSALREL
jgi:hypothetical protein